jgi:hypothetical protein
MIYVPSFTRPIFTKGNMPFSDKKKKIVKQQAELLASAYPNAEEGAKYAKDYETHIINLNIAIEERLDRFSSDAVNLLREQHPNRPGGVMSVVDTQIKRIRELVDHYVPVLDPILDLSFRKLVIITMKDLVDVMGESMTQGRLLVEKRTGEKLQ